MSKDDNDNKTNWSDVIQTPNDVVTDIVDITTRMRKKINKVTIRQEDFEVVAKRNNLTDLEKLWNVFKDKFESNIDNIISYVMQECLTYEEIDSLVSNIPTEGETNEFGVTMILTGTILANEELSPDNIETTITRAFGDIDGAFGIDGSTDVRVASIITWQLMKMTRDEDVTTSDVEVIEIKPDSDEYRKYLGKDCLNEHNEVV